MSDHSLLPSRPSTKRSQVAAQLMREIEAGRWAVHESLPPEMALMDLYGVSRHTVRAALADLQAVGMVVSTQGVGSRVVCAKATPGYSQSLESISELAYYARNTSVQLVSVEDVLLDEAQAQVVGAEVGAAWCHAVTLRAAAGQQAPMGLSSVWVPAASKKAIQASRRSGLPVFLEVQKTNKQMVGEVRQVIGVGVADAAQAKLLQCDVREPLLRIQRWYFATNKALLEMSDSLHPQGRFQYAMTLRHVKGSAGATHTY
ncbi:GntR family transcriptional regulator [Polaromonas jejuensis]|uniref:GntR family transcriptional regulator n=1 Tax=Polaromonas jejuensis TaxID=457502 RepID=A0ABW0Q374_9BURK|nr:GntR family transcriptional regulator [Polaromonas jejuensis]